ncbi:phosphoribosyltransferase family protein [Flavobacteriaceae bacterium]|nr:phosphoribosyltransferase family protein [Flavobacteriaceae bacterium]MDA9572064.1 phosphoribosyltransferase family protein [Flavobacteriaceae bacterium]
MTILGDKIKTAAQIQSSIRRIAYQIYENNFEEKEIVIVGIASRGSDLAHALRKALESFSNLKITHGELRMNKDNPRNTLECDLSVSQLENQSIVIVDDVLNTGSTLIYAVQYFLTISVKQIKTAVMVNRNHKKFPIKADFKGISLSTSTNEHVTVILEGEEGGVFLR